jgi:hypothetical protein
VLLNPQPDPEKTITCTTHGYFGIPRAFVSRCETYPGLPRQRPRVRVPSTSPLILKE